MNKTSMPYTSQEQKVLDVFNRHVRAFTSGNLDKVVSDFADNSVVITPETIYEGQDEIRVLYAQLLAEFGSIDRGDSPGISIDVLQVRHDTLVVSWHAESMNHIFAFGTDTFVCDDDKVMRQSIIFTPPTAKSGKSAHQEGIVARHGPA